MTKNWISTIKLKKLHFLGQLTCAIPYTACTWYCTPLVPHKKQNLVQARRPFCCPNNRQHQSSKKTNRYKFCIECQQFHRLYRDYLTIEHQNYTACMVQKIKPASFSSNIGPFSKSFNWHSQLWICNKVMTKDNHISNALPHIPCEILCGTNI